MRRWGILVVLLTSVILSGVVVGFLVIDERRHAREESVTEAREITMQVYDRLKTTESRLATTAGLFAASETVRADEFSAFVRPLIRDPTIDNVIFLQRLPRSARARFERRTGRPIVDGTAERNRPSPARPDHFIPGLIGKPSDAKLRVTFDVASNRPRRAGLLRATDRGAPQATAPIRTLDTGLPAITVYTAIYRGPERPRTVAQRRRSLRGLTAGVLPLRTLLPRTSASELQLTYEGRRIAGSRSAPGATTVPITILGKSGYDLRIDTGVRPNYTLAYAIGASVALLAMMIGLLVAILMRRNAYAQRLVRDRLAEQRKAEEALAQSESRLRLLAETSSDWVTLIDSGGHYTYCSPSVERLLGLAPADVVGRSYADLLHPDDVERMTKAFKDITEHRIEPVEARARHRDGHWIPLEIALALIRDPDTGEVAEIRAASRDVTERQRLESELRRLAVEDAVTGLPNRRALYDRLRIELEQSDRYGDGALVLLDLDEFKQVNDTHGHSTGDEVLRRVGAVLEERLRGSDIAARLGGDEFAIVLPRARHDGAVAAADAVLEALRSDSVLQSLYGRPARASAGVAMMDAEGADTAESLMSRADQALYAAKRSGRDRVGDLTQDRSPA